MDIEEELKKGIKILKENNQEEASLKAKLLLSHVLNQEKEYLVTHDKEELTKKQIKKYNKYIIRMLNNEPIQHIIGYQEFMGLKFMVNKNVLIPRPDTEILVEEVLAKIENEESIEVLDLCTGSGAIAISLKNEKPKIKVTASDISKKALKTAKRNAKLLTKDVTFVKSDLFKNIKNKFDIIVSNPPYIKTNVIKELSKDVQKEPIIALDGGNDGLFIYRKIADEAYKFLKKDGILALEIGYDQKEEVITLLEESNKYINIYSKKDFGNNDRIVICQKKEEF